MAEERPPPNQEEQTADNLPQDSVVNHETHSQLDAKLSKSPSALPGLFETSASGSSLANRGSAGNSSTQSRRKRREAARAIPLPDKIGEYDILREIGRGGMGVVYEVTHQVLKRRAAIKFCWPCMMANAVAPK